MTAPIPAGTWQFVGDGAALSPATVRFTVLWRPVGSTMAQTMLTFEHHFDSNTTNNLGAATYDDQGTASAFGNKGDLLTLEIEVLADDGGSSGIFVPNGDPSSLGGRFMHLTIPH